MTEETKKMLEDGLIEDLGNGWFKGTEKAQSEENRRRIGATHDQVFACCSPKAQDGPIMAVSVVVLQPDGTKVKQNIENCVEVSIYRAVPTNGADNV